MDNADEFYQVHVINLDSKMERQDIIKSLLSSFEQYVNVLYFTVSLQSGVIIRATIGVRSFREAEYALFELHGEYLGSKRMQVSFVPEEKGIFRNLKSTDKIPVE